MDIHFWRDLSLFLPLSFDSEECAQVRACACGSSVCARASVCGLDACACAYMCVRVRACACVCVRVRACACAACARVCTCMCMLLLLPLSPHTEACVQACVELAGGQGPGPSGQGPAASGQAGAELAGTPRGQGAPLASNPGGRGQGPGGRVVREELRKLGAKAPEVLRTMHPSHNLRKRKRG